MQKGARSFAEDNIHGLSGGGDMSQGTVPAAAGAAIPISGIMSQMEITMEELPMEDTDPQTWAARVAGASHWDWSQR